MDRLIFHRELKFKIPTRLEAEAILTSHHDKHTKVYLHSKAVADLATLLADKLSKKGLKLNLDLVYVSGLLHDLAKGKPDHALVAGKMLRKMRYLPVAKVVEKHIDIPFSRISQIDESAIVYLADKLLRKDEIVSLEERYRPGMERYHNNQKIRQSIKKRLDIAKIIKNQIEKKIGTEIHFLMKTKVGYQQIN